MPLPRPCLGCGTPVRGASRCPACQAAREAKRGTTTQRGLGYAHRKRVKTELGGVDRCQCQGCGACGTRGCGRPFTKDNPKTGDHVTPRSRGGASGPLQALCRRCNSSKGARTSTPGRAAAPMPASPPSTTVSGSEDSDDEDDDWCGIL